MNALRQHITALAIALIPGRAARIVLAERQRQVTGEGWTLEHDDGHVAGAMALAAACYAIPNSRRISRLPTLWPWAMCWWKPSPDDRIRELAKAGALILAEIDRELRAQERFDRRIRSVQRNPKEVLS